MKPLTLVLLAAVLLSGCSLLGLYDHGCCSLPPGPPSGSVAAFNGALYSPSGLRVGTIVSTPTGAALYGAGGAFIGRGR